MVNSLKKQWGVFMSVKRVAFMVLGSLSLAFTILDLKLKRVKSKQLLQ